MVPFGWGGVVLLGGDVEAYGDLVSGLGRRAGVGEVDDAFHGDGGDGVEQVEVEQSGQHLARGELGGLPSGFGPDLHGDGGAAAVFEFPAAYPFDGHEPLGPVCGHFEVGGQAVAVGVGVAVTSGVAVGVGVGSGVSVGIGVGTAVGSGRVSGSESDAT